ncbi:MAG: flagellar biosynthesis anti-sigma factor FlgM [Terriglobia bacterium]
MNIGFPNSTSSSSQVGDSQQVRSASNKPAQSGGSAGTEQGVEVSLSETGIQALTTQLASLPSIRQDRVQALQQAVSNGTYQVSNKQIANAIHADLFGASSDSGS